MSDRARRAARAEIIAAANLGREPSIFRLRRRHIQEAVAVVRWRRAVRPSVLEAAGFHAERRRQ